MKKEYVFFSNFGSSFKQNLNMYIGMFFKHPSELYWIALVLTLPCPHIQTRQAGGGKLYDTTYDTTL